MRSVIISSMMERTAIYTVDHEGSVFGYGKIIISVIEIIIESNWMRGVRPGPQSNGKDSQRQKERNDAMQDDMVVVHVHRCARCPVQRLRPHVVYSPTRIASQPQGSSLALVAAVPRRVESLILECCRWQQDTCCTYSPVARRFVFSSPTRSHQVVLHFAVLFLSSWAALDCPVRVLFFCS